MKASLDALFDKAMKAEWKSSAALKSEFGTASKLTAERVVFNIKGNDYRLIVAINYHYQVVRIKWLGTPKEYDKIDASEVEDDKYRYADSPDSAGMGSEVVEGSPQGLALCEPAHAPSTRMNGAPLL